MAKVLLLDDEMTMVQMAGEVLRAEGHQVIPFTNGGAAVEQLGSISPELVMATLGPERARAAVWTVLQRARSLNPPALVLMITAAGSTDVALEAMKKGAYDCLSKPFTLDELKLRVQRALSYQTALSENLSLRRQVQSDGCFQQIITQSPRMQAILKLVERVADSENPILIQGPPGTGKQLLARTIHLNSRRRLAPFIPVNCALGPEDYLESELFGQRKSPFSSGPAERAGLLREAEGGTVYLYRISALTLPLQGRLLEVLQNQQVVGDGTPLVVDLRILAGSDEALDPKLANGTFLRELYRCLNTSPILLPDLKERPEDIPLLISHFLRGRTHGRTGRPFVMSPDALEACCACTWPGNVRELENSLQQTCLDAQDHVLQVADLPRSVQRTTTAPELPMQGAKGRAYRGTGSMLIEGAVGPVLERRGIEQPPPELVPLKKFLRDQEINYLHQTLAHVGGSKERAAELLGISLATIYRKLSEPADAPEPAVSP